MTYGDVFSLNVSDYYWTELATCENTMFEFDPISRIVPTTMMRMTATITAYSAMS
jgi:hypothetical protein